MAELKAHIENTLNESRMLVLGAQVLLGFEFQAAFQKSFDELPAAFHGVTLFALGALVVALALVIAPAAYHRIGFDGAAVRAVDELGNKTMAIAPLALGGALAGDVAIVGVRSGGDAVGWCAGGGVLALALLAWYGPGFLRRRPPDDLPAAAPADLTTRVEQVLIEARVVLPGVQALLGFGLVVSLTERFATLPPSSRAVHLASLLLIGASIVALMLPAAFHRIVERGAETPRFVRVASALVVAAMAPLALAIAGDLFVVVRLITGSAAAGLGFAAAAAALFLGAWYGYPLVVRLRSRTP